MNVPKVQRMAPRVRFPFGVRGAVFSIMVVGLAAAMITAYTGAVFTDTANSTGNTFNAGGALDLQVSPNGTGSWTDDVVVPLTGSDWLPGDDIWGAIYLRNTNDYQVGYSMTSEATVILSQLGQALQLEVWTGSGLNQSSGCSASAVAADSTKVDLNTSNAHPHAFAGALGDPYTIFGHPALGSVVGDRPLGPTGGGQDVEMLCVHIVFPLYPIGGNLATPTAREIGGTGQETKFQFVAQQTAHNPAALPTPTPTPTPPPGP